MRRGRVHIDATALFLVGFLFIFVLGGLPGVMLAVQPFDAQVHDSWNRKPRSGYKVIYVPFSGDQPGGAPVDVLTGFLGPDGQAFGRPVGVAVDSRGALRVADDVGKRVWHVSGPQGSAAALGATPASAAR